MSNSHSRTGLTWWELAIALGSRQQRIPVDTSQCIAALNGRGAGGPEDETAELWSGPRNAQTPSR
jgi:hypothetical protein